MHGFGHGVWGFWPSVGPVAVGLPVLHTVTDDHPVHGVLPILSRFSKCLNGWIGLHFVGNVELQIRKKKIKRCIGHLKILLG